jgi:hypothetical protein
LEQLTLERVDLDLAIGFEHGATESDHEREHDDNRGLASR